MLPPLVYVDALCQNVTLTVPFSDFEISRQAMAVLSVAADILIMISFILGIIL